MELSNTEAELARSNLAVWFHFTFIVWLHSEAVKRCEVLLGQMFFFSSLVPKEAYIFMFKLFVSQQQQKINSRHI